MMTSGRRHFIEIAQILALLKVAYLVSHREMTSSPTKLSTQFAVGPSVFLLLSKPHGARLCAASEKLLAARLIRKKQQKKKFRKLFALEKLSRC
jgi:hypothetical protein